MFERISFVISSAFPCILHSVQDGHMSWTSILFTAWFTIYKVSTDYIYPTSMEMAFFCGRGWTSLVILWCDRMTCLFILLILSFSRIDFLGAFPRRGRCFKLSIFLCWSYPNRRKTKAHIWTTGLWSRRLWCIALRLFGGFFDFGLLCLWFLLEFYLLGLWPFAFYLWIAL